MMGNITNESGDEFKFIAPLNYNRPSGDTSRYYMEYVGLSNEIAGYILIGKIILTTTNYKIHFNRQGNYYCNENS